MFMSKNLSICDETKAPRAPRSHFAAKKKRRLAGDEATAEASAQKTDRDAAQTRVGTRGLVVRAGENGHGVPCVPHGQGHALPWNTPGNTDSHQICVERTHEHETIPHSEESINLTKRVSSNIVKITASGSCRTCGPCPC